MGLNRPESADLRPRWPRGGKKDRWMSENSPLCPLRQIALELMGVMGIDQDCQGYQTLMRKAKCN